MEYFLNVHSLSDKLEQVTYLSLIVGVSHFPILGKNFRQSHFIIITEFPQNNITHILIYFKNFPILPFT